MDRPFFHSFWVRFSDFEMRAGPCCGLHRNFELLSFFLPVKFEHGFGELLCSTALQNISDHSAFIHSFYIHNTFILTIQFCFWTTSIDEFLRTIHFLCYDWISTFLLVISIQFWSKHFELDSFYDAYSKNDYHKRCHLTFHLGL